MGEELSEQGEVPSFWKRQELEAVEHLMCPPNAGVSDPNVI